MTKFKTLLAKILRVKNTIVEDLTFEEDPVTHQPIAYMDVRPYKRFSHICPHCGRKCSGYDHSTDEPRKWRHTDIGSNMLFLRYAPPRIYCPEHKVVTAAVPWADHDCWFTRDFDDSAAWFSQQMSKSAVSKYLQIDWATVGRCISRVKNRLDKNPLSRFDNLRSIAVDETSIRKGHVYITVVINNETGKVIWIGERHGKETFMKFLNELTAEQREGIHFVAGDGARWIDDCIKEKLPNCTRCVEGFHVVQWANEALDEQRRETWRELQECAKELEKSSENQEKSPEQEESAKETRKMAKTVKGSQYTLGKAPENLTDNQRARLEFIEKTHPRLFRAYVLKEHLRYILKMVDVQLAEAELKIWYWRASHSRLEPMKKLAKKIKRHRDNILNTIQFGLSSAKSESANNAIKLILRKAYGFRNMENMKDMIMLCCSNLEVQLPGRAPNP